jgi:hypothetical protein
VYFNIRNILPISGTFPVTVGVDDYELLDQEFTILPFPVGEVNH